MCYNDWEYVRSKFRADPANRYHTQSIHVRARAIHSPQRRNKRHNNGEGEVEGNGGDTAALVMSVHWSTRTVGALTTNRFRLYMVENQFFHNPEDSPDRRRFLQPFARGQRAGGVVSFDQTTLPSCWRYNTVCQFKKIKLRRWDTKVVVVTCASAAFCVIIEVYGGAKPHLQIPVPRDNNSVDACILRNMNALLPPSKSSPWFYPSVKLALKLCHRRMYLMGTIEADRRGFAEGGTSTKKYRTVNKRKVMMPPQDTIKLAEKKKFPYITSPIAPKIYQHRARQNIPITEWEA
ncbi:hypothetical protein PHMEG_00021334 [Phytophthora megakarya]|uniref:PiggyBac transposable element-derived protein domain-containing protein n=1 Tax=Phytophthora megakarya TaxID=4795 RepID=A0A225VM38_9STRA|nr:hypothetical protein PHMEG_00021334 [Phytophthora megakarya]